MIIMNYFEKVLNTELKLEIKSMSFLISILGLSISLFSNFFEINTENI